MIHPDIISKWLNRPAPLPQAQKEELTILLKRHPYFVPARYMEAAQKPEDQQLPLLLLYAGNRVLLRTLLQAAQENTWEAEERTAPLPADAFIVTDTFDEAVMQGLEIPHPGPAPAGENPDTITEENKDNVFQPIYTEDYFLHQGINVSDKLPEEKDLPLQAHRTAESQNPLMVMMSFSEWLQHFKTRKQKEKEEEEDQKALKTMWQKEKLAAALEEDDGEIPENVFEMAVNSIAKEEGLASESLAEILIKQGKYDKAIDMYKKLGLRNPQKNAYFAGKIEAVIKLKNS